MKKLISLVLTIAMITSMLGTSVVFAAGDEFFDDFSAIVRDEERGGVVGNYAGDEGILFTSANELYHAYKHWESNNPPVAKSDGTTQDQYIEGNGATGANADSHLIYQGNFSGQYLAFETSMNGSTNYTAKQYYEAYSPKISVSADGSTWTALTPEYLDYRLTWNYIGDNAYFGKIGTFVIESLPENTNYLKVGFVGDWAKKILSVSVSSTGSSTAGMVSISDLYSDLALYDDFSTIVTTKDRGQLDDGVNEGGKYAYADWHLWHKIATNVSANGEIYSAHLEGWPDGWGDITDNHISYSGEYGSKTLAVTMGLNDAESYEAMVETLNFRIYAGASSSSLAEVDYTHYLYGDVIGTRKLCTFYIDSLPADTTYIKFMWDGNWVTAIYRVVVTADNTILAGSTSVADGSVIETPPTAAPTASPTPSPTPTPTPEPTPTLHPSIVIYDQFNGGVTRYDTTNLMSSSGSITTNSEINGGTFDVTYARRPDGSTMNDEASVTYDVSAYDMTSTTMEMGVFYLYSPEWGVPAGTSTSTADEHLDAILLISQLEVYESIDGATYTPVTTTLEKYPGPNPGQSYHYVIYNAATFNQDTQFVKIVMPSLAEERAEGMNVYGWDPGLHYVKFVDQSLKDMQIVEFVDHMDDSTKVYDKSSNITYMERAVVTSSNLYPAHQDLNNPYTSYMANREWAATQTQEAYFVYEIEDADKTVMTVDTFFYNSGLTLDEKLAYSQLKIYTSTNGVDFTEKTDVVVTKIPGPWSGQSFHYVGYTVKDIPADTTFVKISMPDISEAVAAGIDIAGWEPYIDKVTFRTTYGADVDTSTKLSLPNVYMNNMVLQAGEPVVVTGTAAAGKTITATLSDGANTYTATGVSDENESFKITFAETFDAGYTPYTLSVTDGSRTRAFANIVFGDVYLCIGQSNMEMNVWDDYYQGKKFNEGTAAFDQLTEDINNATDEYLRVMRVSTESYANPSDNIAINYRWKSVTSDNVWSMTAIGFHFGKVIRAQQDYPIGIIDAAWGGTAIEPWLVGGTIYNSHVHPIRNMNLKGVMWYQGESNSSYPDGYAEKNIQLVDSYREIFGENTPFGIVQLANFENDADFRLLREEQLDTFKHYEGIAEATGTQNTFTMLSIIEHVPGDKANIHPEGKKEIAHKFATWANAVIYGTETEYTGPVPMQALKVDGGVEVTYTHYGNTLTLREGAENVGAFKVYSTDSDYEYATGTITGVNKVFVATEIANPVKIAYATDLYNTEASLMNDKGFGCTAFQPIEVVNSGIYDVTISEGKVTKVSMVNADAKAGQFVVAVYDGNILLDVDVIDVAESDYTDSYVEKDVTLSTEGATKIKAMFVNGLTNIMPEVNVYKK